MKNNFGILIISILFSLVTNIAMPTAIVVPFEVNNGVVKEVAAFIHTI